MVHPLGAGEFGRSQIDKILSKFTDKNIFDKIETLFPTNMFLKK